MRLFVQPLSRSVAKYQQFWCSTARDNALSPHKTPEFIALLGGAAAWRSRQAPSSA
jgi:hypothetical protein